MEYNVKAERENMGINIACISACGGAGCTSAARALARITSKILKKIVLVISLDVLSSKTVPSTARERPAGMLDLGTFFGSLGTPGFKLPLFLDDYGVSYASGDGFYNPLHALQEQEIARMLERFSELYDLTVIDLSLKDPLSVKLSMCCEKTVVIAGYLPSQAAISAPFYSQVKRIASAMPEKPLKTQLFLF